MPRPRLHLDADASIKALQAALTARGHDVTRTPNEWVARDGQAYDYKMMLAEHVRRHATLDDLMPLVELLKKTRKCMGMKEKR